VDLLQAEAEHRAGEIDPDDPGRAMRRQRDIGGSRTDVDKRLAPGELQGPNGTRPPALVDPALSRRLSRSYRGAMASNIPAMR
jgi:hypothetical protein